MARLNGSARGFAFILSGTALAQMVTFAILPVLSRLYSPIAFGNLSLVLALTALVAPIAGLRLESAAMLPKLDNDVRALAWNCLLSIAVFTVASGIAIQVLLSIGVESLQGVPYLSIWVASLVLLTALFSLLSQLALRRQLYSTVATRSLYQSAGMAVGQLVMSLFTRNATGLLTGHLIGRLIGLVPLWLQTSADFGAVDRQSKKRVWRKYWRFPAVFAPSALMNALGTQAPVLFVISWYGVEAGGQVGMAERIVGIPLGLIGVAAGQVLEAEISKKIRDGVGVLRKTYLRLTVFLSLLGIVAALGFGLLGGWLIPLLLGSEWNSAGIAVQIMALNAGIRLVASPLSKFLLLYQRSLANTALDITRVILMLVAFALVIRFDLGLEGGLFLIYSSLSVTYVFTWMYGLRISGKNVSS